MDFGLTQADLDVLLDALLIAEEDADGHDLNPYRFEELRRRIERETGRA